MPTIEGMRSFQHNFYEYEDLSVVNLTGFNKLCLIRPGATSFVDIPRSKKVEYHADEIAEDNWNRGLARLGNRLLIGSSPARILEFDIDSNEFVHEISLEKDMRHCIHGLEILEA